VEGNNKKLIRGTIIYAIGNFGTKILSFLIVPLYTYYISTGDMGDYDLLNSTVNLLIPLITLQIFDAAFTWMIRGEDIDGNYARSAMQVVLFNSLVASVIILFVASVKPFNYSVDFVFLLVTSSILTALQKLLRGLKKQKLFVYSSMAYTIVFLILNIVQICILKMGVRSLFISATIANLFAIVFCFVFEKRLRLNYFSQFDIKIIRKMLSFSAPLIPNQLNWWVMNSFNRYIIRLFLGASSNGIFAIANKFPSVLQMLLGFFNTSWQDMSVAEKDSDVGAYYSSVFRALYRLSFSSIWILVPATKIVILLIMSKSYKVSAIYTSFLYLGTVFQSFSSFYGVGYLRGKNTKQASLTSIYGAVSNALLNIFLIKFIGLQAASISTFLGFFIMWIIREEQTKQNLSIVIDKIDFMLYFIPSIVVCCLACISSIYLDVVCCFVGLTGFIVCNRVYITSAFSKIIRK